MKARLLTILAAALVSGGCSGSGEPESSAPAPVTTAARGGDFYAVPDPLPPGRPGDLIRAEPAESPPGSRVWRVLYHSRALDGRDIAVSGLVAAPAEPAPAGGSPVLAWAHGTTGLADPCAPSKEATFGRVPFHDYWLYGYVVAATDYEGLGTPGLHPYLVGASEGRSVLDAVRAARRLERSGAGRRAILFGHSQGGHAVLFAGEIAASYAPDVDLLGVVAAAPAAELLLLTRDVRRSAFSGYIPAAVAGFAAVYPDAQPERVLTADALADLGVVDEGCIGDVLGTYADEDVLRPGVLEREPWRSRLIENTPGRAATPAPILVVHGTEDEQIPVSAARGLLERLCRSGDTAAELRLYRGVDH
ncbi:MAG: lipase family protein, partial [Gaiellaceae bacterium]